MAVGAAVFTVGGTAAAFTTTSPAVIAASPVGGDPRAVALAVVHNGASAQTVTAVTYGGVAMSRVEFAVDALGEAGTAEIWFLGTGIPTGDQDFSITHGGAASVKWPVGVGYLAATDTEAPVFGKLEGDQADPQIVLNTAVDAIRIAVILSGHNAPSSLAVITGMSAVTTHDFTSQSARYDRQTSNSTGSFTIGYTATIEDVAMVAIAIQEVESTTIAFDAVSEFITSLTASPRTWTHTPVGTPAGVLVYAMVDKDNTTFFTAASYGGVAMTLVSGGVAHDAAGEFSTTITFFLGSGIPTGPQTVSVTQATTAASKTFQAITVTAAADTEIVGTPVILEEDGALSQQNVDSGAVPALRFAGGWWGGSNIPTAGSHSTAVESHDYGSITNFSVRERNAGTGIRPVGVITADGTDDRSIVHLAIAEVSGGGIVELAATSTGVSTTTPDMDTIVLLTRANVSTVPRVG